MGRRAPPHSFFACSIRGWRRVSLRPPLGTILVPQKTAHSIRSVALRRGRTPLVFAGLFSLAANLLYLALPLYMIQVYDRVLTSESLDTLIVLTVGVVIAFVASGAIEEIRTRVLINYGMMFDRNVASHLFRTLFEQAAWGTSSGRSQALRDLDVFRQTMTGTGIGALFDLPWTPVFLLILFMIDPVIGGLVTVAAGVLLALAVAQDRVTRGRLKIANDAALRSYAFT